MTLPQLITALDQLHHEDEAASVRMADAIIGGGAALVSREGGRVSQKWFRDKQRW